MTRKEARFRGLIRYKPDMPCKHGHWERYTCGVCVGCIKETKIKLRAAGYKTKRNVRATLSQALYKALKRRPTTNSITRDQLFELWKAQRGKCAVTKLEMKSQTGGNTYTPYSVSLDRKNSKLGYTKKNVRLICMAVNTFRGQMSDGEMLTIAKAIVKGVR